MSRAVAFLFVIVAIALIDAHPQGSGHEHQCGPNEVFNPCGSACAPTCARQQPSEICTANCIIGCQCKDGYLKNSQGVCVLRREC